MCYYELIFQIFFSSFLCSMTTLWPSPSTEHIWIEYTWEKKKRCKREDRDNYMESEHCSWESSLSLSAEREAVWRGYLFFIWRWKLKSSGESPGGNCWLEMYPSGVTVSLLRLSPTPVHFPSPTFLISGCHRLSGKEGEEQREKRSCALSMPSSLPHSQTLFIPHCCGLQSSARLCSAVTTQLNRVVLWAPPRLGSVYVGSITSYPSPPH